MKIKLLKRIKKLFMNNKDVKILKNKFLSNN